MFSREVYRAAAAVRAMAAIPSLRGGVAAFCLEEDGLKGGWWYESPERWLKDHGRGDLWAAVPDVPDLERCCLGVQVGIEEKRREVQQAIADLCCPLPDESSEPRGWAEQHWHWTAEMLPILERQRDALDRLLD